MMRKTKTKTTSKTPGAADGPPTGDVEGDARAGETPDVVAKDGEVAPEVDSVPELQAKVERLQDSLLRAKADFQNMQRRSNNERADAIRYANAELLKSLLGVVDDFERSLAAAKSSDNLKAVVDGVGLVHENLLSVLRAQGVATIEALHKPFDPGVHEALMQQPSADHPPGTIVEEIAKGYRLGDRVLRPAKVVVSKAVEPDGDADDKA